MKSCAALIAVLALCGCGASNKASDSKIVEPPPVVTKVGDPQTTFASKISLVRKDVRVYVGDQPDQAFQKLLDGRSGGFTSERLPDGFSAPYVVRAWEGADEGFGIVANTGRVVAAMYQETKATQDRANEVRQAHQRELGDLQPEIISGDKVTYYFWEIQVRNADDLVIGAQRLVIMGFQTGPNTVFLMTAMGDSKVLDGLGLSMNQARQDQIEADKIMQAREAGANSAKT